MLFIPIHIQFKVFSFFDPSVYVWLQTLQDVWLSWYSAPMLAILQLSGFEPRHFSKLQNGRHKQRSGLHTLARQKILYKKIL
jgi:hypothetical protein